MKKETAKNYLPFVQAWSEGKTVQERGGDSWIDVTELAFSRDPEYYRIKPEPKLREWSKKEFPPIGLYKNGDFIYAPVEYRLGEIVVISTSLNGNSSSHAVFGCDSLLKSNWKYSTDGSKTWLPCGVLEGAQ